MKGNDMKSETLVTLLDEVTKKFKKKEALLFEGRKFTYAEVNESANKVASGLEWLGIKPGDRVAIMLPNIPEFVFTLFGIQKLGAVAVPFNTMYKGREITHILNDSGAKALVTLSSNAALINEIRTDCPELEHVIYTGERTLVFFEPEGTASVQLVVEKEIFEHLEQAFERVGELLLRVLGEFGITEAWYKHRGSLRHEGKKLATITVSEIENLAIINSVVFLDDYNLDEFFKVIWVSPEIKDKVVEPMTSVKTITGEKPSMDAFRAAVEKHAPDLFGVTLEPGELKRDEKFGYEKTRSMAYKM